MAEKDATVRLRRAVKENNLFLVKRLIQRTDMRNPDPGPKRYTSLAWAAVLGHEETFEFLLTAGHDDEELSRESENNTILMLLADFKPPPPNPYAPGPSQVDLMGAALRMARLYYERYPWILDWSNVQGKTALHMAALKGNEEARSLTSSHRIVQLLIERGCQFAARNNDGFTASDYAYSFSTRDTLQDSARMQFETNKKSRRMVFAQAAARGNEWPIARPPPIPLKPPSVGRNGSRMRSSSGGSRTTATSDSGDVDSAGQGPGQGTSLSSLSASSTTSQPSRLPSHQYTHPHSQRSDNMSSASSTGTFPSPGPSQGLTLNPPLAQQNSLSPIVNRMRERDADEIEKYMRRNRSGSAGTASTDNKSQNGNNFTSAGPSANGDDITALASLAITGSTAPRKSLRPSFSAAQLRTTPSPLAAQTQNSQVDTLRNRSGTNPSSARPAQATPSPIPVLTRASSSDTSQHEGEFPEPPKKGVRIASSATAAAISRRLPSIFSSKSSPAQPPPTPTPDPPQGHHSHRRGSSTASIRG
ncbi:hypothetical protein F4604DRAFT_1698879 [Suillus subluteus]|nr:hypothetical protein F4604DRAFT_1698879 [Suillus subluteus]